MKRSVPLCLFLLSLSATTGAFASRDSFDCGLITGLRKAAAINDETPNAYGNVALMSHRWEIRTSRLLAFAREATSAAKMLQSPDLQLDLLNVAEDVSHFEGGHGDVKYWVLKNTQIGRLESSILKSMIHLENKTCR